MREYINLVGVKDNRDNIDNGAFGAIVLRYDY